MELGNTRYPAIASSQSPTQPILPPSKTFRVEDTDAVGILQFVTTTGTVAIDETSKRAIRKHASRYVYRTKPQSSQNVASPAAATRRRPKAAAGGQVHRFRLGPKGLKHTPNQPAQVSRNFTILSLKSDEPDPKKAVAKSSIPIGAVPVSGSRSSKPKRNVIDDDEDEDEPDETSSTEDLSWDQSSSEVARQGRDQQKRWLVPLIFARGGSLFGPSSGTMDPFNAMALPITPREQILLRHYCSSVPSPFANWC